MNILVTQLPTQEDNSLSKLPTSSPTNDEALKSIAKLTQDNYLLNSKLQNLEKEMGKELEEIKKDKVSVITITGIFVSIFTIISIEIQILRYVTDFARIAGFTLLFGGLLGLFIFILHIVAFNWINPDKKFIFNSVYFLSLLLILSCLFGGCYFIIYGDHTNSSNFLNNSDSIVELKDRVNRLEDHLLR